MNKVLLSSFTAALIFISSCSEQAEYDSSLPRYNDTSSVRFSDTSKLVFTDSVSAPVSVTKQLLPTTPVQSSTKKSPAAINPAHGSPGHRCDIAVGAPLNTNVQPTQKITPAIQPPTTKPQTSASPNGTVKLNPAHGQPGHDCAIPVGVPLKG